MIWRMCLACFHMIALNYQQAVRLKLEQEMQQMNEFMLEIIGTDESRGVAVGGGGCFTEYTES